MTLFGERVAQIRQGDPEPGLTLWKTPAAPRVSTWVIGGGALPNPVIVDAFSCVGALDLDLTAPTGQADAYLSVGNLAPVTVPVLAGLHHKYARI